MHIKRHSISLLSKIILNFLADKLASGLGHTIGNIFDILMNSKVILLIKKLEIPVFCTFGPKPTNTSTSRAMGSKYLIKESPKLSIPMRLISITCLYFHGHLETLGQLERHCLMFTEFNNSV